jgi:hypothetical protein
MLVAETMVQALVMVICTLKVVVAVAANRAVGARAKAAASTLTQIRRMDFAAVAVLLDPAIANHGA